MPPNKPVERAAVRVIARGRVQGVGFRYFVHEKATALALSGWVRNRPDGAVEAEAEGPTPHLEQWVEALRRGPSHAHVENLEISWISPRNLAGFEIRS